MKFICAALYLWMFAIKNKPNRFGFCRERLMFWDSLNGTLYINGLKYVALKGSEFEEPDVDSLLDILRKH